MSSALGTVSFVGTAAAAPVTPRPSALVAGTPCNVGAVACVSLGKDGFNGKAWFIRNGKVVRGPVAATTGGPGKDTSTGTFKVLSKDRYHKSSETTNAAGQPSDMPYSVFYTSSGEAFHGGGEMSMRTAGCTRLANENASYWFENLKVGDTVQVVQGSASQSSPSDESDDGGSDDNGDDDRDSGKKGGGLLGL